MVINIKLTSACDSRCSNCRIWASEKKYLSPYVIMDIISQYKNHEFIFNGGECLLHPDIYEIIKFSSRNNVNFVILSNGINYDRVEKAIQCGARRITLSVDGYDHDILRGVKGNLQTIRKILRQLFDKADFRLAYVLSNSNNLEKDKPLLDELISLGANDNVYFAIMQHAKSFNIQEYCEIEKTIVPQNLEKYSFMSLTSKKYLSRYPANPIKSCRSPEFYITICEDGKVRYCQAYNFDFVLGNVNDEKLSEILRKSRWIREQSDKCSFKNECWLACHRRYDVQVKYRKK